MIFPRFHHSLQVMLWISWFRFLGMRYSTVYFRSLNYFIDSTWTEIIHFFHIIFNEAQILLSKENTRKRIVMFPEKWCMIYQWIDCCFIIKLNVSLLYESLAFVLFHQSKIYLYSTQNSGISGYIGINALKYWFCIWIYSENKLFWSIIFEKIFVFKQVGSALMQIM